MNKIKAICFLLIISIAFSALCSCKDNAPVNEPSSSSTPSTQNTQAVKQEDIPLLKIYTDDSAESYKALPNDKITAISIYGEDKIRAVALESGISVKVEQIEYIDIISCFHGVSEYIITEKSEKGKIYEFNCEIAETIPQYRIIAEYNGLRVEYYFQYDGKDNTTEFILTGSKWKPKEITESSPMLDLCYAYALCGAKDNAFLSAGADAFWGCFEEAVCNSDYRFNETSSESISLTEWTAQSYLHALFPMYNGDYPKLPKNHYAVSYEPSKYEKYKVSTSLYTNKLYLFVDKLDKVEENKDGTLTVKIIVSENKDDGSGKYINHGKAVLVKPLEAFNEDNPFEYVILGVSDYKVEQTATFIED